jgi:hypothetical protein
MKYLVAYLLIVISLNQDPKAIITEMKSQTPDQAVGRLDELSAAIDAHMAAPKGKDGAALVAEAAAEDAKLAAF